MAEVPPSPMAMLTPRPSGGASGSWYYRDWSGDHGPRSLKQLTRALQKGYFTPDLLVLKEGTHRWHTLRDVLDLRAALSSQKQALKEKEQRGKAANKEDPKTPTTALDNETIQKLFQSAGKDWYYLDNQGRVQGPFSSVKMQKWACSPQYKQHFQTLKCRRGPSGPFQLLPELAASLQAAAPSPEKKADVSDESSVWESGKSKSTSLQTGAADASSQQEVEELRKRLMEMEEEMEQLRSGQEEDSFILRMQLEKLHKEKTDLAKEVITLKREKECLEELLRYAQHFDIEEEEMVGLREDDEDVEQDEDEATQKWYDELRLTQERRRVESVA